MPETSPAILALRTAMERAEEAAGQSGDGARGVLASIECINLEVPEPPPSITAPFLGTFQMARDSLYKIPDPSEMICKAMTALQLALAPVRQWLEMLEAILAIKNCLESIPKAIMTLSPSPIFDCLKQLVKIIARLLSYQPPLSYIKSLVDICRVMVLLLDEIINLLSAIDDRLSELAANLSYALSIGDTKLIEIVNCGSGDLKYMSVSFMEMMKLIMMPVNLFVEPIIRFIPDPKLQKAAEAIALAGDTDGAVAAVNALTVDQLSTLLAPLITPQLIAITAIRASLVMVHNVLCHAVGAELLANREMPTFRNL